MVQQWYNYTVFGLGRHSNSHLVPTKVTTEKSERLSNCSIYGPCRDRLHVLNYTHKCTETIYKNA